MNNIIPYGRQKIFKSDFVEINKALKSNFITNGEYVKKFESSFFTLHPSKICHLMFEWDGSN